MTLRSREQTDGGKAAATSVYDSEREIPRFARNDGVGWDDENRDEIAAARGRNHANMGRSPSEAQGKDAAPYENQS